MVDERKHGFVGDEPRAVVEAIFAAKTFQFLPIGFLHNIGVVMNVIVMVKAA